MALTPDNHPLLTNPDAHVGKRVKYVATDDPTTETQIFSNGTIKEVLHGNNPAIVVEADVKGNERIFPFSAIATMLFLLEE